MYNSFCRNTRDYLYSSLMLENISLIASIICGLTAITTSLRAVGTAREYSRNEAASNLKTGCRIGGHTSDTPPTQRSSLKLHLIVTVIWFILSIIFMVPVVMQQWSSDDKIWFSLIILSYLVLLIMVVLIWRMVKRV
jgi:membrane protein insertase Oxa1/YidC/SpoIIIJ